MNSKCFFNGALHFIYSKGLLEEFYNTLSKSDMEELTRYLEVE